MYWYRPAPRDVNCDSTDTTMQSANNASGNYFMGRPDGWQTMSDSVFVVTMLTSPGDVTVTSGGNTQTFTNVAAGVQAFQVPMGVGRQSFSLKRNGNTVLSGTSLKDIINGCVCGLYNFNAYVGSLPAGFSDPLGPDALQNFAQGLKVACAPTPSLGTNPPPPSTTSTPGTKPPTSTTTTSSTSPTQPPVTSTTPTSTKTSSAPPTQTSSCAGGSVAPGMSGNYIGLCQYACGYGYCPRTLRVHLLRHPQPTPPTNGRNGCPIAGEDSSYLGLCSFACNHGYCPPTACQYC